LKTLQDVFGYINDVRMAPRLIDVQEQRNAGIDAARAAAYRRSTRGRGSPRLARSPQGLERPGTLASVLGLMRLTAEIRWFWPDRPPPEFHGWFVGAGATWTAAGSTKTRGDEYLRDQDSLGIKNRGRSDVEIKGLISHREKHLNTGSSPGVGDCCLQRAQSFLATIARSIRVMSAAIRICLKTSGVMLGISTTRARVVTAPWRSNCPRKEAKNFE
jgi:hypothetical protein